MKDFDLFQRSYVQTVRTPENASDEELALAHDVLLDMAGTLHELSDATNERRYLDKFARVQSEEESRKA